MPTTPALLSRRRVLQAASVAACGGVVHGANTDAGAQDSEEKPARRTRELRADVVVVGAGVGGCAAALAACRRGNRVILTEPTDWIGGQFTQQAVPPDEHPWIEQFGATRAYRELRRRIRDYYRRHYPLTAAARAKWNLDPGNGRVSALCHEPRVALAVLRGLVAPFQSSSRLTILLGHEPVAADVDGDTVRAVTVRSRTTGNALTLHAAYFVDASELGDLLPLTGAEHVTGAEARAETGEPHAAEQADPANMQAFTFCFAIDYLDGQDHTIDKPAGYEFWRTYVPELTPPWTGPLLSLTTCHPHTLAPRTSEFDPAGAKGMWCYRRIADKRNFTSDAYAGHISSADVSARYIYAGDISLINWPQNDYWLGNLIGVSPAEAAEHIRRAKELSLSLLYWLQTEAPRPDGGTGWPGLRLRRDIVGTEDGLAKHPYIREARRIRALFTVTENHVGTEARMAETGQPREEVTAVPFADSVGVGSYRIDLHPSSGGDNYIDISSLPFQIPLGALIPVRIKNLLPACKNIGTTHISNGCYRLHPVEWNIGESVGLLSHYCLTRHSPPRAVREKESELRGYQHLLRREGVELAWPQARPR
jgi:hypothetical protein